MSQLFDCYCKLPSYQTQEVFATPVMTRKVTGVGRGYLTRGGDSSCAVRVGTRGASVATTNCGQHCESSSPVLTDGHGCDRCDPWFHPTNHCTKLNVQATQTIQRCGGNSVRFVCDGCRVQPQTSTPLISATPPAPATPGSDAKSLVTFSQLLQLVKSLSDAVAGLTAQVQQLAARQNSTPRLPSPSTNCNGIQLEHFFEELREFDERKKT